MDIVFLDRDGVINQYPGRGFYVTKIKDFHFIPGSLEAIADLTRAGYKIFVISNQAGVGRGIFSLHKLNQINAYLIRHVEKAGGKIRKTFYCTHKPDEGCECRKPGIGMVKMALHSLNKTIKDAKFAYFVGDTQKDIQAGQKAGCTTIFVRSGGEARRTKWEFQPDYIVKNLKAATEVICHENSSHPRNRRSRA